MRHWLLHPLIFYPLAALAALLLIGLSIRPQAWPRPEGPVAGQIADGALVLQGDAFTSPAGDPEQAVRVVRDFWGRAQALRIATLPQRGPPASADPGVRILLTPASAEQIAGPVIAEVRYNILPVNGATSLAVSLQGPGSNSWVNLPLESQDGVLRFDLPARPGATAIGLRAMAPGNDQNYGVEITRIRIAPR